jgi:hypothetical protein
MRRELQFLVAATTTITIFQGSALAGVSDDLVFCSKLANSKERIACYDAAARIAGNSGTGSQKAATPAMVSAPAASIPAAPYKAAPAEKTPFQGAYATIGGAYSLGSPINLSSFDAVQQVYSVTGSPHGASVVGSFGYNIQFGNLVTGLEVSGRYGRESFSDAGPLVSVNGGEFGIIGTSTSSSGFNVDASVHAAIRTGLAFGETLAFVKAGAGMAHASEFARSNVNATRCDGFGFVGNTPVCSLRTPLPSVVSENQAWVPSVLFGLGIEHNFGPVFGRVEVEAEGISRFNQNLDLYWTARAMALVGVRF